MRESGVLWHPFPTIRSRAVPENLNATNPSTAVSPMIRWTSARRTANRPLSGTVPSHLCSDVDLSFETCYNSKMDSVLVPPPEERLCVKHGRPITVKDWLKGCRTSECALCKNIRHRCPQTRSRRAQRWDNGFVSCIIHLDRRCNRSFYVHNGNRKCGTCHTRNAEGELLHCHRLQQRERKKLIREFGPLPKSDWYPPEMETRNVRS